MNPPTHSSHPTVQSLPTSRTCLPLPARSTLDRVRWPDVARLPRASAARTAVARGLVRHALARLPLWVRYAESAESIGLGGPLLEVHDPGAFHRRIGADGLIGFGESYMAGEWDAPDLVSVLTVLAQHATSLVPAPLQQLRRMVVRRQPATQRNTPQGSRDNIQHHYDLSNDLFALFLDETLTYSSAVFRALPADRSLLAAAQRHKIDLLLDAAGVGDGTRLLEIGTGWGELAVRAARRGALVRSITLSREQQGLARSRIAAAGHADAVRVDLRDYREVEGEFDSVVSVEMIEAVGVDYWPAYFRAVDRLLVPGGRATVQAITMAHDRLLATKDQYTWIHKYIFPGGVIPSLRAVEDVVHDHTALRVADRRGYGAHYAETLRLWREEFTARAADAGALGFDETFRRMWAFYLAYSEAGFRSGYLDVHQIVLTKTGESA